MKRGLACLLLIVILTLFISFPYIKAYDGFGYGAYGGGFAGLPSIAEVAQNEWFNAGLLFLLIFAVCWFVLQQVFATSRGAAVTISIVLGIMGALGIVFFYGPILTRFGNWFIVLVLAAVVLLLFFQLKKAGIGLIYILVALSLIWLLWAHRQFCPPYGTLFPRELCTFLDTIAIAIIIIAVIMFLIWLLRKLSGKIAISVTPKEPKPPKEPKQYPILTISVEGAGEIKPKPGQYKCKLNQKVKVGVDRPYPQWKFSHWVLDGQNIGHYPQVQVIMNTDHHLIAVFTKGERGKIRVTVSILPSPEAGVIRPAPGTYEYDPYTKLTIAVIRANPGYRFKEWLLNNKPSKKPAFTINLDPRLFKNGLNLVAVFVKKGEPPPKGKARFDIFIGGKLYTGNVNESTTELVTKNKTTFVIKNGGTGGTLQWAAAASRGLDISPKGGSLKKDQTCVVTVTVTDRNVPYIPHVTVFAKAGESPDTPRELIGKSIAKAFISFVIK